MLGDVPLAESAPIVDLWVPAGAAQTWRADRRLARTTRTRSGAGARGGTLVLIWSGPGGRAGARRAARRAARPRRQGRLRRVLRARDAERPRRRRRLGRLLRRGAAGDGLDRPADRLGRRGRRRPERARPRRARRRRDRDLDVPRTRRRLGRPRPAGHELPRARRHLREPRGPAAAAAPHGDPARAGRARVDLAARRRASASRSRRIRSAVFAEVSQR